MTTRIPSIAAATDETGLFTGGHHRPMMAMVEITNRCNMRCPICFTDASAQAEDIGVDEIKARLDKMLEVAGPIPLQISGGEPTLHPQLPEIINYARHCGFKNIELISNGIAIGRDPEYLCSLVAQGLTAVYLQFDGLSRQTHQAIRGRDMREVRQNSIAAIRSAKICCTLAVAVTRGVNDHELGEIVTFGIQNIDTIRAINFQSATRFSGRFDLDPDVASDGPGFSLSELTALIEQQSGLESGGFVSDILGHPQCNAMSLVYLVDNRLEPLFRHIPKKSREAFLGKDRQQILLDLFRGKEYFCRKYLFKPASWKLLIETADTFGRKIGFNTLFKAQHILLFAKSFMDRESLDDERLSQCCYGIAQTNGIYSFCAYNNLHRFKNIDWRNP